MHQGCPWFPEQGTVNVETWKTVGEKIKDYYCAWGPEKVPVDVFPIWAVIKDCLKGDSESSKWEKKNSRKFYKKNQILRECGILLMPPHPRLLLCQQSLSHPVTGRPASSVGRA